MAVKDMVGKQVIQMYWGNNGLHEFWQDENLEALIIRLPGEIDWEESNGKISDNLPEVITLLEKTLGIVLELNTKRIWVEHKDKHQNMILRDVR